jgi:two-component system sensor histidine kinase KdpD
MNATWIAVHVETPGGLPEESQKQLAENIRLAEELGAEVITTADTRLDKGLLRIARQENATHILIGKSGVKVPFWRRSLFDRLVQDGEGLDIYLVAAEEEITRGPRFWKKGVADWRHYVAAAMIVSMVTAICFPFSRLLGYQTVSLLLLVTVTLLSLRLRPGPILLAAGLSAALWDFLFIPPLFTFNVGQPVDVLMLMSYFTIAIVTGVLSSRSRANEIALRQREERASALFNLTGDLSKASTVDGVVRAGVANVRRFFRAEVVVFLGTPDGDFTNSPHPASTFQADEKEFGVAAWAYWNEKKAGRTTDTLPSAGAMYYPLSGPRYSLGVIGVKLGDDRPLTADQESLLKNFMDQIASGIERENLSEVSAKAMVFAESERLYKALFDSMSHEVKTPLAAIAGSAEGLLDESIASSPDIRRQLILDIHQATERLERLVENLLDMTRLESGLLRPKFDWCDIPDLLNSSIGKLSRELGTRVVHVDVKSPMPLVKLDFGLLEQAIGNLLLNAAAYSDPSTPIEVSATVEEGRCVLRVADSGPGIPPGMEEKIFEKFFRLPGTRTGGTGLGLSIVRGFVLAHNGTIKARTRSEGGAEFTLRLPIEIPHSENVPNER